MCLLCKLILNLIIGFILIFIYTPYVWKWNWNIKDKDTRGRRNWLYLIHRRGACVQWYCMGVLLIHCLYNYDIMLVVMVHTNVRGLIIFFFVRLCSELCYCKRSRACFWEVLGAVHLFWNIFHLWKYPNFTKTDDCHSQITFKTLKVLHIKHF